MDNDTNDDFENRALRDATPRAFPVDPTPTGPDAGRTPGDASPRDGDSTPPAVGGPPPAGGRASAEVTSMADLAAFLSSQDVDVGLAGELRSAYIKSERDDRFRAALDDGLKRIGTRRRDGTPFEGRGVAVVAESGAGKSQAVRRGLSNHPLLGPGGVNLVASIVVSVLCLGSCTLRILGEMILEALGYPAKPGLRENEVWALVRHHLELHGVLVVHIDEVNNLTDNANDADLQRAINNFKALINNPSWPVVLVLSGIPSIGPVLKKDMQLRRRLRWTEFKALSAPKDSGTLAVFAKKLCATAGLAPMGGFAGGLAPRLIHASCSQLGLAAEMCVEAVEAALDEGHPALGLDDFAAMYAGRTGCDAVHNPFVNPDWKATDPRVALGMVQGPDDGGEDGGDKPKPGAAKKTTKKKGKR